MVKQPAMEASEFQMSNEDFPALPGLSGPAPGQSAPAAPVPSSMDDLSGAPGALPNQLGGQPQGVIGSTISSSDMILQSTQQGKKILEFFSLSLKNLPLVPCFSMDPKFWTVQIILDRSTLFWLNLNHFGQVQIVKSSPKSLPI